MNTSKKKQLPKHRQLHGLIRIYFITASALAILCALYTNFHLSIGGINFVNNGYLYVLLGLYLPLVFLLFPAAKTEKQLQRIPWYDILIGAAVLVSCTYLVWNSSTMVMMGWEYRAPLIARIVSLVIFLSVLEAARRACGFMFFVIVLFFGVYALFAGQMPGFLHGKSYSLTKIITFHALGSDSIVGIPMRTTGSILIGFMIFAVALIHTGAGNFFIEFAKSLLGPVRGGSAKISIVSSALMGSISGSVISNVLSTGSFTIPAMKKSGYPSHYAGAVEACSSTGGTIMPPVMGATAFIMAEMLEVSYSTIIGAALIPSLLYFTCIFFQVDAYAAVNGIKRIPRSQCMDLKEVLKDGWYYLFGIFLLITMVVFLNREAQAAWVATAVLFVLANCKKANRFTIQHFADFLEGAGRFMAEIVAILAACGLIIGSMVFTGIANSFAFEVVAVAGDNTFLLLLFGAIVCFVLGMGMTISACYIFLALVFAPAMTSLGFDRLAVHFFILYWGMASYITPPVAMGSFAAATIAKSDPIKTGLYSMRMGFVAYVLPFFFVLNPALIGQGEWVDVLFCTLTCFIGIVCIGMTAEGYILGIGKIPLWLRPLPIIGGALLCHPFYTTDAFGMIILAASILFIKLLQYQGKEKMV